MLDSPARSRDTRIMLGAAVRSIHITNFGLLHDVELSLEPLTVLIGPNDVGKSTVLRALAMLGTACRHPAGWAGRHK